MNNLTKLFAFILCICTIFTSCENDSNKDLDLNNTLIDRSDDFIGRKYEYLKSTSYIYPDKYVLQFYANQLACERIYRGGSNFAASELTYSYKVTENQLTINSKTFQIESEYKIISTDGAIYELVSTNGPSEFQPSDPGEEIEPNPGDEENADNNNGELEYPGVNVTVSPISGAGEINFVIKVKCEKEPSSVKLLYTISMDKLEKPILTESRDARWVGHPVSDSWQYMTYALGPKYCYVYYTIEVRVLLDGQYRTVRLPVNYNRIVN